MKLYIGTQFRGHDSAISVINSESKDIFCMSTERLTRYKHDSIYPIEVIKTYLKERSIDPLAVKEVNIANSFEWHQERIVQNKWYEWETLIRRFLKAEYIKDYVSKLTDYNNQSFLKKGIQGLSSYDGLKLIALKIIRFLMPHKKLKSELYRHIKQIFKNAEINISYYNHHLCHAVSSFYASDFKEALCITVDGFGDGSFSKVYSVKDNQFNEVSKSEHKEINLSSNMKSHIEDGSIGGVYAYFTGLLGFRPLSDEGKVEALAAYGNHENEIFNELMKLFEISKKGSIDINETQFKSYLNIENIKNVISNYKREDVAAAVQKWLEEIMLKYVEFHVNQSGIKNICLSGGVAANVIMNLRIFEEITPNISIVPAMTDEGSSQGAAILLMREHGIDIDWIRDEKMPYWGTKYSKNDVLEALDSFENITQIKVNSDDWESEVSKMITEGKIGAIFHGKMEWGPRALGNRSILADPKNKASIDKINNQIKRREPFQPFCPSILEEEADRLFDNSYLNKHMTCAFRMKEEFHEQLPGAIHVDGTARVQFVNEEDNPSYYKIIKKVKEINGFGVVLNTSFNMHGRSMVQSPNDAIRDFLDTGMDYLVLEGVIVKRNE